MLPSRLRRESPGSLITILLVGAVGFVVLAVVGTMRLGATASRGASTFDGAAFTIAVPPGYEVTADREQTKFGYRSTLSGQDGTIVIEWGSGIIERYGVDIPEMVARLARRHRAQRYQTTIGDREPWIAEWTNDPDGTATTQSYFEEGHLAVAVRLESNSSNTRRDDLDLVIDSLRFDQSVSEATPVPTSTRPDARIQLPLDCAGRDQETRTIVATQGSANARDRGSPNADIVDELTDGITVVATGPAIRNGTHTWHEIYVPGTDRCVWVADIVLGP